MADAGRPVLHTATTSVRDPPSPTDLQSLNRMTTSQLSIRLASDGANAPFPTIAILRDTTISYQFTILRYDETNGSRAIFRGCNSMGKMDVQDAVEVCLIDVTVVRIHRRGIGVARLINVIEFDANDQKAVRIRLTFAQNR
jgi:hypothetical protein